MNTIDALKRWTFKWSTFDIHCVQEKKLTPPYTMCDRNAKSECILINYVHLFLNVSVKELPNFMRKYYLIVELLMFKYRWQNISVSNTVLIYVVTCPEVTLCWRNQQRKPKSLYAAISLWRRVRSSRNVTGKLR